MRISFNFTVFTLSLSGAEDLLPYLDRYCSSQVIKLMITVCRQGCLTDFHYSYREEEAIQLDGLNASQIKEIREKSEKFAFQAEVNRMMKLIINSLYKNKEVSIFITLEL